MAWIKRRRSCLIMLFLLILAVFSSGSSANEIEQKFIKAGLVDVHDVDKSLKVDLVNSDADKNIFRENFYKGLSKAYLRKEVAEKLFLAQHHLKKKFPDIHS